MNSLREAFIKMKDWSEQREKELKELLNKKTCSTFEESSDIKEKVEYRYYAVPKESVAWDGIEKDKKYPINNLDAVIFINNHGFINICGNHRSGSVVPCKILVEEITSSVKTIIYDNDAKEVFTYNTPELWEQ